MRNTALLAGTIAGVVLAAVAAGSGRAQPLSASQLIKLGDDNLRRNCVISAMNYYAVLQQFPNWPSRAAVRLMRERIQVCSQGSVGYAGTGWIGREAPSGGADAAGGRVSRYANVRVANRAAAATVAGSSPVAEASSPVAEASASTPSPAQIDTSPIPLPGEPDSPRVRACRAYADTALVQAQQQIAGRCRQSAPTWSQAYDYHYDWCMSAATPERLQAEIGERGRILNACVFRW